MNRVLILTNGAKLIVEKKHYHATPISGKFRFAEAKNATGKVLKNVIISENSVMYSHEVESE